MTPDEPHGVTAFGLGGQIPKILEKILWELFPQIENHQILDEPILAFLICGRRIIASKACNMFCVPRMKRSREFARPETDRFASVLAKQHPEAPYCLAEKNSSSASEASLSRNKTAK